MKPLFRGKYFMHGVIHALATIFEANFQTNVLCVSRQVMGSYYYANHINVKNGLEIWT